MNIKWFLCSLTLGIASGPAWAQATPPVADINAAQTAAPISPYVYGQFLEHIGGLIYSGLWSERLEDRKFYYPVIPRPAESPRGSAPEPGFRRRNVTAGCWNPIGPVAAVTMDTNAPFVGQHSPCVQVAGAEPRGLVQAGVELAGGLPYTGHIQLAGEAAVSVVIRVVWETNGLATNEVLALAAGALGKDYQRFSFGFTASQSGPARFEILGTGQGTFHVGAVSLMPSNQVAGFRPEAIDVLKSLRSGVYRVPGGNFVSAHEWRDAIG
ncbi:MAG TPA: alpha-N-arabinofuranosidase, partial [Verrucomicrobiae bacterium]